MVYTFILKIDFRNSTPCQMLINRQRWWLRGPQLLPPIGKNGSDLPTVWSLLSVHIDTVFQCTNCCVFGSVCSVSQKVCAKFVLILFQYYVL